MDNLSLAAQYEVHVRILAALRAAFETVKHHKQYGKRVVDAFRKALPDYVMSDSSSVSSLMSLAVWGKDLPHNQRLYMCWNQGKSWQEGFAADLDRQDPSDSLERMREEESIVVACERMEARIAELRRHARNLVESLPVPRSAVTRREPHFWMSPSSKLAKLCPNLFDSEK